MKITDIKTQVHDETRVSVYVDGAYSFSLSDIDAVKHAVKKGMEISENDLLFFKSLGDNSKAMKAAMDLISRKGVTQKALSDYLLKKGYSKEVCTFVSDELKNLGYIDDFSFALSYAKDAYEYKKHGRMRIETDLRKKGVSNDVIKDVFEEAGIDFSLNLPDMINEKFKNCDFSDFKVKQKIIRYFAYRGYPISEISSALSKISRDY